ncbi:hypothetical protein Hanom_Chr07g00616021 [Helianthus anomalus]
MGLVSVSLYHVCFVAGNHSGYRLDNWVEWFIPSSEDDQKAKLYLETFTQFKEREMYDKARVGAVVGRTYPTIRVDTTWLRNKA